jgi:hypothetical protein
MRAGRYWMLLNLPVLDDRRELVHVGRGEVAQAVLPFETSETSRCQHVAIWITQCIKLSLLPTSTGCGRL